MIIIKLEVEFDLMRVVGRIVVMVLKELEKLI